MTDELYDPRLLVRVHRIYYVSWNGIYWLNSRNWIGASLFLPFGGRWWLESAWQWMANHFFPSSGRKSRKTNAAILVKLGCSTWNKDSVRWTIVSVEGFDYNGYQCRFIHVTYIYIYIPLIYLILCSLADHVAIIWWFHRSTIDTLMHIVRKASFKMLLPNLKRKAEDLFFKREDVSGNFIVFSPLVMGSFSFFSKEAKCEWRMISRFTR